MKKTGLKIISVILALMFVLVSAGIPAYAKDNEKEIKNVILMIGDGMGVNHLEWTKADRKIPLFMDSFPYKGYSKTNSFNGVTDSAAGGTALACGLHAWNSNIGTNSIHTNGHGAVFAEYKNLCEIAKSMGKRAGILTSDENSGATPACFSAHTVKREYTEQITEQQLECDADLLWACSNGLVNKKNAEEHGWKYCETLRDIDALKDGDKSFAAVKGNICYDMGGPDDIPLSVLTGKALELLDCEEGFFIMIEGAHIDKNSHANNKEGMMESLIEFDKSIEKAVDFAEKDGHTLVMVTADHETGGITMNEETGEYEFTVSSHTDANVPLLVYGSDEFIENGATVVNVEIGRFAGKKLGYKGIFPYAKINFLFVPELIKALFIVLSEKISDK